MTATLSLALHRLVKFTRTPKGILLLIFAGFLALCIPTLGTQVILPNLIVTVATAAALDIALERYRHGRWIFPDGAILTGLIVAFILRSQESWLAGLVAASVGIAGKHLLRTHWSNILNPAAMALVIAAILMHTGQSWWGALPDLGILGLLVMAASGIFMANRINKLPMLLAFLATYFTLFTIASFFGESARVAEIFRTPDIQAALFFAGFMLDDPPTSPVRYEDQVVFGLLVATAAYFFFMWLGGVYYLPAGLLMGNAWESGRRLVWLRQSSKPASIPATHRPAAEIPKHRAAVPH